MFYPKRIVQYFAVHACDLKPCQNGGKCHNKQSGATFTCACPKLWRGSTCEDRGKTCILLYLKILT